MIDRAAGPGPFERVVDLGTGSGRMLTLLGKKARVSIGLDLSQNMLNIARSNAAKAGLDKVELRHGDIDWRRENEDILVAGALDAIVRGAGTLCVLERDVGVEIADGPAALAQGHPHGAADSHQSSRTGANRRAQPASTKGPRRPRSRRSAGLSARRGRGQGAGLGPCRGSC